ncbi:hypothetical protein M408DRAFT_11606 [Serendipita vermifera MAFF 305830]|uniref:Uncharacterized protein n=1 Tax=Serendipita vermifera MAFF 305830 TaxID=933852 RepID=A0A0C3AVM0_SERVB|nr:hypothetical protein M408DRAFT_11606 [Serendipita vermifera MAFF 305830]
MRIVYKLEFSFWVRSFLEGRWYTPPRWLHGRLYTLWSSLEARRDAKALEEKETQEAALEETTVTWTARHVEFTSQSTDRLVHILKDATPLFGETSLEGPWVEIMDHISGTCLEKAESQQLSAEDHAAIGVTLAAAMAEYFRRKPSFDRAMDHGTWDRWENTLKLAGPFLLLDDVDQLDMTTFVSILQSRSSTNGKSSAAQLVRATRSLVPVVTTGPERWITSYAIYSLCVYLWTHEHNRSHRQVADRLIEIIDIPSGDLHIAEPNEMCMSLALSALYSVAFGKPERERHFWASAHTLYPVGRTDERSRSVKALNSVLTSHIASAAAQETSQDMVQLHLKSLCRLLAYTPCLMEHNKEVERFTEILERLPHRFVNQHHPTHESSFTALPSVIWLHKVTKIPRIHEYLEVILACQVRFPKLKPVWRSWHELDGPGENNRLFAIFGHDKRWLDQFVHDRRITQVLRAFDQLVDAGCSTTQHVTMIQLAIHDLSDDRGGNYSDYYTKERNAELEHLQDPALRLIGARAAGIAYSRTIPHELALEWSSEPWIEAVRFWCETYRETDGPSDGALLRVALLQSNDVLHSAVIETSSENRLLQDRIRQLLASELDNCVDTNTVLLLHVAAQTAAWFPQYLTETRIQKLVGILDTAPPLDMRVLPVLATLLALIQNPLQAITVLNSAQHVLLENDQYPGQNEVCELTEVVERMILMPPQWLEPDETKEENASRQIWAALNEVSRLLQEPDNAERAVVRWSGIPQYRPKPRQRQLSSLGVEEPFEGRASEDYRGLTDLVSPYGLGTRLLGLLHHSEDGRTSYEGRSLSINNPGAMSQQNVVGMDGDQESIEAVEGSGDRLYSCSAAWDI